MRRQVESQEALAEVQRFQLEATYLTLTSNVVVAAINLASLQAQIDATKGIIAILNNSLGVVRRQFDLGGASRADVLAQEAALTQTQATLPPLEKQLAIQRNGLMRLVGRSPDQDRGEKFDLAKLKLPTDLPLSLPSQLVEQRPDVKAAEAQLHSASADIGVAVSNQMPQFTITGLLGFSSGGLGSLLVPGAGVWSIGLGLAQTVFDGGRLDSQRKAAIAAYERAAAQYRGVVLSAFQDVANALRALQADADTLRAQVAAEQTAAASLRLSEQQYQLGAVNYLILLNAQQTYQTAVINRLRAQAARYTDTAALFQALGGGWWNRTDVDPKSMGKPVALHAAARPGHQAAARRSLSARFNGIDSQLKVQEAYDDQANAHHAGSRRRSAGRVVRLQGLRQRQDQGSHGRHGQHAPDGLRHQGREQRLAAQDRRGRQPARRARRGAVARSAGRGRGDHRSSRAIEVKAGQVLLGLRKEDEVAKLQSLEATAQLAQITYDRDVKQLKAQAISQAIVDNDEANLRNAKAQVAQQKAIVDKKTLRAPFDGKLGLRQVDLGQFLSAGTVIATLQSLDPIFVDFLLPQQAVAQVTVGADGPGQGRCLPRPHLRGQDHRHQSQDRDRQPQRPGARHAAQRRPEAAARHVRHRRARHRRGPAAGDAAADGGEPTIPTARWSTSSTTRARAADGKPQLAARQVFVTTGATRGDQVAILKGVTEGDMVVTSGQIKLRNGVPVIVDNRVVPTNDPAPKIVDK